jgi:RNA 2',3'-cyclic 3'-phosphodiesterase
VRERLAVEVDRLRPLAPDVAWVSRDNLHVTVKFLGNVDTGRVEPLTGALATAAGACEAFEVDVCGLGAFPSRTRARVLWAGLGAGADAAARLAASVDESLARVDVPRETRPFAGHVTLGRVREPRSNTRLAAALVADPAWGRVRVDRLSLMRSDLSPRGARYTELAVAPLAAAVRR